MTALVPPVAIRLRLVKLSSGIRVRQGLVLGVIDRTHFDAGLTPNFKGHKILLCLV